MGAPGTVTALRCCGVLVDRSCSIESDCAEPFSKCALANRSGMRLCAHCLPKNAIPRKTAMLRRLAWSSVPSTPLSPRHIDQIVGSSRLNNVRDHISGMLLFTGGHFLSIVEGDERDLCNLWIRLEQDGRHCKLFRIGDDPCGNRLYPAWVSGHVADPELDDQIASMRGVPNQPDTGRDRVAAEGKFASPLLR